jgi:hypothetical protein
MLLINASCLSFFPSLSAPFPPLHVALHASNKCILHIFLFVTFRALLALFSVNFTPPFKPSLHDSYRCILGIFLSATFLPSRAFFRPFSVPFYPFSVNFYVAFKPSLHASNRLRIAHLSFRHFSRPSRAFFPPFSPSHFIPYFRQF